MRFRFTVFLLVANIITFGLILYESGNGDIGYNVRQSVFSAGISKIEVPDSENAGGFALELRKKDWVIAKPYSWSANFLEVNALLNELRAFGENGSFSVEEVESAGNSLEDYGLEKPTRVFSVSDDAGTHILKIGKLTPDGKGVYVLSPDGKEIIPANAKLLKLLSRSSDSFRTPEIFSLSDFEVRSFSVRSLQKGGVEKRIGLARVRRELGVRERKSEYGWRFETPTIVDAETQSVELQLKQLTGLQYKRFMKGDLALLEKSGLKSPKMRISLEGSVRSQVLLIGEPTAENKSELYAKLEDNDCIFTVDAEIVSFWDNTPLAFETLRDPRILRFEPELLKSVKIDTGENSLVLHRTNSASAGTEKSQLVDAGEINLGASAELLGGMKIPTSPLGTELAVYASWQMPVAPGSFVKSVTPAEPAAVKELVDTLLDLRAVSMPFPKDKEIPGTRRNFFSAFVADNASDEDIKELGFSKNHEYIVEIQLDGLPDASVPAQTITLTIAPPVEPGYPYHAKVGNAVFTIDKKILEVLSVEPTAFRERTVYEMPKDAKLVSLKLTDISGLEEKVLLNEKCPEGVGDWPEELAKKRTRDADELYALATCVTHLSAESFLPRAFSRDFRYDYQESGESEPWRYRLDVGIAFADSQTPEIETYYLTKRLGGTFQLAGSPNQNCIFRIKQSFIDALHKLTFARDASKDVPEIPIPEPVENKTPKTTP